MLKLTISGVATFTHIWFSMCFAADSSSRIWFSIWSVIGSGVGGKIIDLYGVTTLTTGVGLVSMALTAIFAVACIYGRYIRKIPYVSELN